MTRRNVGFFFRRAIAPICRALHPSYSVCAHCGLTWNVVSSHETWLTRTRAVFVLCRRCHALLVEDRQQFRIVDYYINCWLNHWQADWSCALVEYVVLRDLFGDAEIGRIKVTIQRVRAQVRDGTFWR